MCASVSRAAVPARRTPCGSLHNPYCPQQVTERRSDRRSAPVLPRTLCIVPGCDREAHIT